MFITTSFTNLTMPLCLYFSLTFDFDSMDLSSPFLREGSTFSTIKCNLLYIHFIYLSNMSKNSLKELTFILIIQNSLSFVSKCKGNTNFWIDQIICLKKSLNTQNLLYRWLGSNQRQLHPKCSILPTELHLYVFKELLSFLISFAKVIQIFETTK